MAREMAELDVEVLVVRDLALYVTDGDTKAWVPKSVLGDSGTLFLPQGLAEEKGLV